MTQGRHVQLTGPALPKGSTEVHSLPAQYKLQRSVRQDNEGCSGWEADDSGRGRQKQHRPVCGAAKETAAGCQPHSGRTAAAWKHTPVGAWLTRLAAPRASMHDTQPLAGNVQAWAGSCVIAGAPREGSALADVGDGDGHVAQVLGEEHDEADHGEAQLHAIAHGREACSVEGQPHDGDVGGHCSTASTGVSSLGQPEPAATALHRHCLPAGGEPQPGLCVSRQAVDVLG